MVLFRNRRNRDDSALRGANGAGNKYALEIRLILGVSLVQGRGT